MRTPTLAEKVAFLSTPGAYARRSGTVTAIETHFAWVFLAGSEACKLKKPLRHASMDYRTLARRRQGCREELRLNRRLAPSVYRDVVPLTQDRQGRLRIGGRGHVVDWLVWMRRLPARQMLDATLRRHPLRPAESAALQATLGRFFGSARLRPLQPRLYVARLRREIRDSQRELRLRVPQYRLQVDRIVTDQLAALHALRPELGKRAAELRDGHGDLRPEHVSLGQPVEIIDSLEFDAELRRLDPLEEIAFLALEIGRLRRRRCAQALLREYRHRHDPTASDALVHFYMSHRALVRAMVSAWHIGDAQFPDQAPWIRRTLSYLLDAQRHVLAAVRRASRAPQGGRSSVHRRPAFQQRRQ
ncbi:MAG TPA: hypothetical protein VKO83_14040 [Steroidobacteraceae bacterium]|nr:hypothetical protein [Steroidobacteraceae bacterium]